MTPRCNFWGSLVIVFSLKTFLAGACKPSPTRSTLQATFTGMYYVIICSTYRPTNNTFKEFGGTVFKAQSNYSTPRGVRIQWMNFLEGDDVRIGTAFNMTMESNEIDETNFMISVSANCIKISDIFLTFTFVI